MARPVVASGGFGRRESVDARGNTVAHVRYGTTREKHCHLNFSDFCATVLTIAMRRYGDGVVEAELMAERAAMQSMVVHSLLPLAERIGRLLEEKELDEERAMLVEDHEMLAHESVGILLRANRAGLSAVFNYYATGLSSAKRSRSKSRAPPSPAKAPADKWQRPQRLLSLSQLYQLFQDFGVLPDVCDMAAIQTAFAVVKSRLLSDTEDFVDLLNYAEFEEIIVRIAFTSLKSEYQLRVHRLQALIRLLEESGGRRKLAMRNRGPAVIPRFVCNVPGLEALPLRRRRVSAAPSVSVASDDISVDLFASGAPLHGPLLSADPSTHSARRRAQAGTPDFSKVATPTLLAQVLRTAAQLKRSGPQTPPRKPR